MPARMQSAVAVLVLERNISWTQIPLSAYYLTWFGDIGSLDLGAMQDEGSSGTQLHLDDPA